MASRSATGRWGAVAACLVAALPAQWQRLAARGAWQEQTVGLGVHLRRGWFGDLAGLPQSLCVLEVDRRQGARVSMAVPDALTPTSEQGAAAGALVAVNGGFFLPNGRPRGLRKLAGNLVTPPSATPHAAIGWHGTGVHFGLAADDWDAFPDVLEAGPRLLADGLVVVEEGAKPVRHPRTGWGVRPDGVWLFVTADGRTPPARGLTLAEFAAVFQALGCHQAINLDGGGSTTLWVQGLRGAEHGIANQPCDDRVFDAAGERSVADVVLVHAPAVVELDDRDVVGEHGSLQSAADGHGYLGVGYRWAPAGGAAGAEFRAVAPRAGRYAVSWRVVAATGLPVTGARLTFGAATPIDVDDATVGWQHLGEVTVKKGGELRLVATARPDRALLVDAVRFVELAP